MSGSETHQRAQVARELQPLFANPDVYGVDKVCDLEDALRAHVTPGMTLHFAYNQARPMALSNALVRVFARSAPAFTIVCAGLVSNQAAMFSTGIIRRLIASFVGENYPAPSPNRIMQEAINSGVVEIENQSLLVIAQRLAAGAHGFPFAPTRSLRDSSLADNENFRLLEDPFGSGERIGVARAIVPDVTFIHALAADRQGNLLIAPPHGEGHIAAFAASRGIVATAEKIVSPDVIRRFSHLALVPSHRVLSVSEAPNGCHPYGIYSPPGLCVPYVEDYGFFRELQKASRDREAFDAWTQEWVIGVRNHDEYLEKLGVQRIRALQGGAVDGAWTVDVTPAAIQAASRNEHDAIDVMVTSAAKWLEARVRAEAYAIIGSGVGYANLAAWLAVSRLQQEDGLPVELVAEIGLYGFFPKPGDPFIFSNRNIPTCKSLSDAHTILGLHCGGRHNRCLAIIGAAQVDPLGNINSTYGSDGRFLVGSGGANDIASGAAEIIVIGQQSNKRLVNKLPYVTSIGERVSTLITDLGIYEKRDGILTLTRYFEHSGPTAAAAVERIKAACEWNLSVDANVALAPGPSPEELFRIRLYDQRREFLTSAR